MKFGVVALITSLASIAVAVPMAEGETSASVAKGDDFCFWNNPSCLVDTAFADCPTGFVEKKTRLCGPEIVTISEQKLCCLS